jgi:ArsR family transcriptional regulator
LDDRVLVKVLKALADPRRFRMVREIATRNELTCGEIGERFSLSQPTISHHLRILSEAGLLKARRVAQHHYISVNHGLLDKARAQLNVRLGKKSAAPRRASKQR